jgi:hypothetical protein
MPSASADYICKRLKIKYVLRELKDTYPDQKQRIAVALSTTKKFCQEPTKNVNKKFLEDFDEKDYKKVLGAYLLGKVEEKYGEANKENIIKYILEKVKKK